MTPLPPPREVIVVSKYWSVQTLSGIGFLVVAGIVGSVVPGFGVTLALTGVVVAGFVRSRMRQEATMLATWEEGLADITFDQPISEGEVVVRRVVFRFQASNGQRVVSRFQAVESEQVPKALPILFSSAGGRTRAVPLRSISFVRVD